MATNSVTISQFSYAKSARGIASIEEQIKGFTAMHDRMPIAGLDRDSWVVAKQVRDSFSVAHIDINR